MINGVMSIVAAVLFAVVAISEGMNVIWLAIAGIYLLWGIGNLIVYSVKNTRRQKAAQNALKKAEEKAAQATAEKQTEVIPEKPVQVIPDACGEMPAEVETTVGG